MIGQIFKNSKGQVVATVITLMMIISVLVGYTRINIGRVYEQNIEMMEKSSAQTVRVMEQFFQYGENSLALVAGMAADSIVENELNEAKLKEWKKYTPFDFMEYMDRNGKEIVEEDFDNGQMNHLCFLEGMQGNAGVDVSFGYESGNEGLVSFYVPVEVNGKIQGVIFGNFFQSHLEQLMSTYNSNTDIKEYICLSDGKVAATTDKNGEDNIFYMLKTTYDFDRQQVTKMKEALKSGETCSLGYFGKVEISNAYITSIGVGDWSVLMVIPIEKNQTTLKKIRIEAAGIGLLITLLFQVYIGVVILKHHKERKGVEQEKEKLQNEVSHTNQATKVYEKALQTTAIAFEEIYLVDVKENTMDVIFSETNEKETNNYEETIAVHFKNGVILDEEDNRVREFLSLDKMCENLATQDYMEKKYRRNVRDRGIIWCLTSLIVMERENGAPRKVTMAIRSIEELIEQEERQKELLNIAVQCAEAANNAKTEFLSKMSHDFRTPMNAIIGMTTIAEANINDKEKVAECLKKIGASGKHLLSLANKVLDMSKIDSGTMTTANEVFDLLDVLEDSMNMVRTEAAEKNHILMLHTDILDKTVIGDRVSLEQVFVNLLSNAVKYTPQGGSISVHGTQKEEGTSGHIMYEFIFEDNGIGMDREFLEKLYDPFERAEDLRISKIQGAGLGLAIAKSMVQLLNGQIDVESEIGKGTKFTILIPFMPQASKLDQDDSGELNGEAAFAMLESMEYSDKRVLLVEDNEINSEIALEILKTTGLQVDLAVDGKQAVKMLCGSEPNTYDMVFMDIRMPEMDGYEATRTIRSMERADLKELPIIAMTADAFAEDVQSAKAAGMNGHLAKPLDIEMIVEELRKWL